jgi:hypothetical protein
VPSGVGRKSSVSANEREALLGDVGIAHSGTSPPPPLHTPPATFKSKPGGNPSIASEPNQFWCGFTTVARHDDRVTPPFTALITGCPLHWRTAVVIRLWILLAGRIVPTKVTKAASPGILSRHRPARRLTQQRWRQAGGWTGVHGTQRRSRILSLLKCCRHHLARTSRPGTHRAQSTPLGTRPWLENLGSEHREWRSAGCICIASVTGLGIGATVSKKTRVSDAWRGSNS